MIKHLYPDITCKALAKKPFLRHSDPITMTLRHVSEETGVSVSDMKSKSRKAEFVDARVLYAKRANRIVKNKRKIMEGINRCSSTFYNYIKNPIHQ